MLALRGGFALSKEADPRDALERAGSAVGVGHAIGSTDLEMVGRALAGFARVTAGKVFEGLRELDEVNAAVVAGELKDAVASGWPAAT